MKDHRLEGVRHIMGYTYRFSIPTMGAAGGLSLWWNDPVQVTILFSSKSLIHTRVRDGGCDDWCFASWVYGDLNEYLWDSEKAGGRDESRSRPRFLQEFMSEMELVDLHFSGPAFTWRGSRNGSLVQERLDRGMVNGSWQDRWPNTSVTHGTVRASDHCYLIIKTKPRSRKKMMKLFRFESFWIDE
ncbi:hypothetical protein ACFX1S_036473 [Malus domestica]